MKDRGYSVWWKGWKGIGGNFRFLSVRKWI